MRNTIALGLVLVAAFATPALAQSFVGDWTATAHLQGAEISETLNVTKTNGGYAINVKPPAGTPPEAPQAGPATDIVLDGNNFSYKRSLTVPEGSITLTYAGVVSGDTFTGTAKIGDAPVSYTGVRIVTGK